MRPFARLALAAMVAAVGPMLSACESFSLDSFDLFDSKKKLTGERKPVFPEGVPGVASGIPPEMVKGYREPEGGGTPDPAKVAAEAAAEPAAKPKKPASQRTASKPAPKPQAPPDPDAAAPNRAAAPGPAPQAAPAPWPTQQPQAAWPGAPGTVSR